MALKIEIQNDDDLAQLPTQEMFRQWVESALLKSYSNLEQTIRIVGEAESQQLNKQFRDKDAPTNVLSFAAEFEGLDYAYLGDLVICAPIVEKEAQSQSKSVESHWAHLVIHGMLHLQGLDHQDETQAEEMECSEIKILSTLGFTNPYNTNQQ